MDTDERYVVSGRLWIHLHMRRVLQREIALAGGVTQQEVSLLNRGIRLTVSAAFAAGVSEYLGVEVSRYFAPAAARKRARKPRAFPDPVSHAA